MDPCAGVPTVGGAIAAKLATMDADTAEAVAKAIRERPAFLIALAFERLKGAR